MRHLLKLSLPAIAASLLIAACGSSSPSNTKSSAATTQPAVKTSSPSSAVVVKSASSSLGTILVDSQGMTLYHLSGEQNGKFICTSSACLGVWHPLVAPSSGTPSGEVGSLGTVKRPEGTVQLTYKGTPLYTFAQDKQSGETNGQLPAKHEQLIGTRKVKRRQRRLRLLRRSVQAPDPAAESCDSDRGQADGETRTPDPFITSEVLYQLSYVGADSDASSPSRLSTDSPCRSQNVGPIPLTSISSWGLEGIARKMPSSAALAATV
jgi:predicted lipoprotein with Yx(FWY)xxD motif